MPSFEDLRNRIAELLGELAALDGKIVPPGATESDFERFRVDTGLRLPAELEDWLSVSNGPFIGQAGYLGVGRGLEGGTMEKTLSVFQEFVRNQWFPICSDGCGNYYVFDVSDTFAPFRPVLFIDCFEAFDKPSFTASSNFWLFVTLYLEKDITLRHVTDDEEIMSYWWPFHEKETLDTDPELGYFRQLKLCPWQN